MSFWNAIESVQELHGLLQKNASSPQPLLILKHSPRCAISTMAKNRIERNPDSELSYFLIDVIAQRNVSNQLATDTDITHESPQIFLYAAGELIDVKSHSAIDPSEISRRIQSVSQK